MYETLGIVGHRKLLVAGIYNCMGPLASTFSAFTYHFSQTNTTP
jgi:hypothetical protein